MKIWPSPCYFFRNLLKLCELLAVALNSTKSHQGINMLCCRESVSQKQSCFPVANIVLQHWKYQKLTSNITICNYRLSGQKCLFGKRKWLYWRKFTHLNRSDFFSTEVKFYGQEWLFMDRSDIFFPWKNRNGCFWLFFTQKSFFPFFFCTTFGQNPMPRKMNFFLG